VTVGPPGLDPASERARVLLDAGRPAEAEEVLRNALAAMPEDGTTWCLYALCLVRLGRAEEALHAASRAAALEPEEEWPHRLASIALCSLGDHGRAVVAAREAIRREPDLWQTHAQLALAAHELKNPGAADEAWRAAAHAVTLAPEEAETHFVMGVVAQERGDLTTAETAYERALSLDPSHAAAMNNLGLVQLRRGKLHQAVEGFTSSLRSDPRLEVARENVESVGWRLTTYAYYLAFGGWWVLRFLHVSDGGGDGFTTLYAVRIAVGLALLAGWAVLGVRMVGRLPSVARRYLAGMPSRVPAFGLMAAGILGCVLGTMFAAFTPHDLAFIGMVLAGISIFVSFITSWLVTINARKRKRDRRPA